MIDPPNREEAIFAAVLQLLPAERGGYLEEACAGDARLRQQVEAFLRIHDQAGTFLEAPAEGAVRFLRASIASSRRPPSPSSGSR